MVHICLYMCYIYVNIYDIYEIGTFHICRNIWIIYDTYMPLICSHICQNIWLLYGTCMSRYMCHICDMYVTCMTTYMYTYMQHIWVTYSDIYGVLYVIYMNNIRKIVFTYTWHIWIVHGTYILARTCVPISYVTHMQLCVLTYVT